MLRISSTTNWRTTRCAENTFRISAKKTAKVTVRKVDGAEKYQITYSTKSNFKKAKTVTVKKASASVKKFKSKKTYYVKVRALKTIAGKTVKTGYSNVKKVKVNFNGSADAKDHEEIIDTKNFKLDDIPAYHAYCDCEIVPDKGR